MCGGRHEAAAAAVAQGTERHVSRSSSTSMERRRDDVCLPEREGATIDVLRNHHHGPQRNAMSLAKRKEPFRSTSTSTRWPPHLKQRISITLITLLVLCMVSLPCQALPSLSNLHRSIEWTGSENRQPVFVAKLAQLAAGHSNVSSLRVTHNFTSERWMTCPFTNWTCSSQVAPSAKLSLCTGSHATTDIIATATGTSLADSTADDDAYNLTVLDTAGNGHGVAVSTSASNVTYSSDGKQTVLAWVLFNSTTDAATLLTKTVPLFGSFSSALYSVEVRRNRTQLHVTLSTGSWVFAAPASHILRSTHTWIHVAVVFDPTSSGSTGGVRAFVNSAELVRVSGMSAPQADKNGTMTLGGGVAAVSFASVHIVPTALSPSEVACVYGCLERFATSASLSNGLQMESIEGGQQLLISGVAPESAYQSALQSVYLVSYESSPDPLPRLVMLQLADVCSTAQYHVRVYQRCVNTSVTCPVATSRCLESDGGDDARQLCLTSAELSTQTALPSMTNDSCPVGQATTTSSTTSHTATAAAPASPVTASASPPVISSDPSHMITGTGSHGSNGSSNGGSPATDTSQVMSTEPTSPTLDSGTKTSDDDGIIAGVSDGFAIGIIVISIAIMLLLTILVTFMVRHYRAQKMMVVGGGDGSMGIDNNEMSPGKKTNTGRRRYVYRSYAETQTVQLQSTTTRMNSMHRGGGGGSQRDSGRQRKERFSVYDDFGMSAHELESDPRPEVRDLSSAFFKTPVSANVFFKPSIVPLKKNAFTMGGLPGEADDSTARFSFPRHSFPSAGDGEDELIHGLPEEPVGEDTIVHTRNTSDPYVAPMNHRRPSKGSMDWSSQDELEASEDDLIEPSGNLSTLPGRLRSSRDELNVGLDNMLDDKVLQLARTGTKRQKERRGSFTGRRRHGASTRHHNHRSGQDVSETVVIGNHLTSII
ncbi:uncharacterized protein LOC135827799 [Sycon ciliatum]|uniref:uncharacterized protein LOC135827799 n=1 Tax=Sycon ciliatum TaxID=27933 RepID=UPI0031F62ECE